MHKKILFGLLAGAVLLLSGCNSNRSDNQAYVNDSNYDSSNLTTLFLVDEHGYAYANVPYKCNSMYAWSKTAPNGEFSFVEPDSCLFDFEGLDDVYFLPF